jgi:hypothetical protein
VTHSPYARAPDLTVTLSRIVVQYLTLIFHQHRGQRRYHVQKLNLEQEDCSVVFVQTRIALSSIIIPFIIITTTIRHQSALDRPVSTSPNTLFEGLLKPSSSILSTIQHYFWLPVAVHFS